MPPISGPVTAQLRHAVGTWTLIGPATAGFSVGNLGFKRVSGTIPMSSAHFEVAADGNVREVNAVLDIASIDTGHARRDSDLRKPGLLDLANHPQLIFSATQVTSVDDGWSVNGLLAAKGVTRAINLAVSVQELSDEAPESG